MFLARETEIQLEQYSRKYERDLESLRKWTDAYVALMVSVTLVVVVSLVSMMIYSVGTVFILGLAAVMIGIAVLGDWIIYRTSPVEPKTHSASRQVENAGPDVRRRAACCCPRGAVLGAVVGAGVQHRRRHGRGGDHGRAGRRAWRSSTTAASTSRTATSRRSCARSGSIVGAIGTTVTEGMERMNQRSLASLEQGVRRLHVRLRSGIQP